ncbi:MAG: hypothetical protein DI573_14495 [Microbacterium sp.]|uniref:hypothetical protein n=1 Tax=Microbacterium sp. TaxID=51671 RepID=UPI000DB74DBE|nr:hypothetical protein [Microbacterium sp.]PZU36008.1 MAG: hypothetical protein DI573_14495 [Microbacterium sp.]
MLPETMNVLSVVVGVALILVGLRDVFHTLFHPAGRGGVSTWVMRGTWRVSRWPRGSPSPLAGPVGIVLVIVVWAALQVFGWTLIYLPQMPDGFSFAPGINPDRYPDLFILFTAAVSWIMQLYPALNRRRTTTLRTRSLVEGGFVSRLERDEAYETDALVMNEIASALAQTRVDLMQSAETYYFAEKDRSLALPQAMTTGWGIAKTAKKSRIPIVVAAGEVLTVAVSDLATLLQDEFLQQAGDDIPAIIDAIARDQGGTRSAG